MLTGVAGLQIFLFRQVSAARREHLKLGTAKWLEDEHWRRMEIAVANGIAKALKG